jgi:hypothetical protein
VARWPDAIWQPVAQHGGAFRAIAVTLHHQAGNGNPASVYASRHVSAHFWIPLSGTPVQHVDSGQQAWHGMAHNAYSLGVETEGCGSPPYADPLNDHQLTLFGNLMRWAHGAHGIPLVLSEAVTTPGLNYHRCQGGPSTGCPCQVRVNARGEILRRAGGAAPAPGPTPPPPPSGTAPPFPGRLLTYPPTTVGEDVRTWQGQMAHRGWTIGVDGQYGPQSKDVCTSFQREKGLGVDGVVGPQTWNAAWTAPVT